MDLLLEKNIKVIGVSKDSEKSHANFRSKFNLNFDFTDEQIKLLKQYGDQITAIYYSEKNNKGKLKIQAIDYPEI